MSLSDHLTGILDKANAAIQRGQFAVSVVNQIQTLENENRLTPQIESALEPQLEIVRDATTPTASEYEDLDDALTEAENICKNAA
jgi:phage shock protein A